MASSEGSNAPIDRIRRIVKEQFEKFKKTPYTIPVAIGITAGLHYLMLQYMMGSCWIGLLPPLFLFGLFWQFDIKRVRKLLLYGLIGCTILMAVSTAVLVSWFQSLDPVVAISEGDDPILVDGIVTPTSGGESTVFTYSITYRQANDSLVNISDVEIIVEISSINDRQEGLMALQNPSGTPVEDGNFTEYYYNYPTTLSAPINQFQFLATINGTHVNATDYYQGDPVLITGPIFSDSWAVAVPIIMYITLYQSYLQFFAIYAIICGMVWWMRRARRMREKATEQWEQKRKEMEAKPPTASDDARVPSMSRAMGLEAEPETFVCSECGIDVPGDAKRCPSCGEKFD
jgi:hypothetical protein